MPSQENSPEEKGSNKQEEDFILEYFSAKRPKFEVCQVLLP